MRAVTIIQRIVPHYRLEFFELLRRELAGREIALRLVYGQEKHHTLPRSVEVPHDWAHSIRNRYLTIGGRTLVWQPCAGFADGSDLVILGHESSLLVNPLILFRGTRAGLRTAFWGHGRNMQSNGGKRLSESIKSFLAKKVDWWFAYTESGAGEVSSRGFPRERITVVNNSRDTGDLVSALGTLTENDIREIRAETGISGENPCLFCGRMIPEKRLDFLVRSCLSLRERVPGFEMIFIGDGPERRIIESAAEKYKWIHYAGARFGRETAPYLAVSRLLLMPGLVGLGIVDSFAAGIPLVTTESPLHSPEIEYLENGVNGVITGPEQEEFVSVVAGLLDTPGHRERMAANCRISAERYSLGKMVENFAGGIENCLKG